LKRDLELGLFVCAAALVILSWPVWVAVAAVLSQVGRMDRGALYVYTFEILGPGLGSVCAIGLVVMIVRAWYRLRQN
jgi:hypothetical protein